MGFAGFRAVFMSLLKMAVYVLLGLVVFALTTVFLNRRSIRNDMPRYTVIKETDSCYFDCPDSLFNSKDGLILFYVDTKPCAKCSESIILNTVKSIRKAGLSVEPTMVYHMSENYDMDEVNDYYDRYAGFIDLVVSDEDSIMIRNPWLPHGLAFYGIVTDSLNNVKYAGSLADEAFLACCNSQFGVEATESE